MVFCFSLLLMDRASLPLSLASVRREGGPEESETPLLGAKGLFLKAQVCGHLGLTGLNGSGAKKKKKAVD